MDILVRVLGLEEQHLGHHQVGHVVLDLADQKDHPLLEQARVDVVGTLAARRLLDHHGYQAAGGLHIELRLKRIAEHSGSLPISIVS
ncbi:hypothetical protein D3C75_1014120 [compost metagenome]